jgi:hypothetical protein
MVLRPWPSKLHKFKCATNDNETCPTYQSCETLVTFHPSTETCSSELVLPRLLLIRLDASWRSSGPYQSDWISSLSEISEKFGSLLVGKLLPAPVREDYWK